MEVRHAGSAIEVAIGLGSNLGDRESHIARAASLLAPHVQGLKLSRPVETQPVNMSADAAPFLNAAAIGWTELSAQDLLGEMMAIEEQLGRRRTEGFKNESRTIDLDLLLYGDDCFFLEGLSVPHPAMQYRRFVLQPLAEIAPAKMHPGLGLTVRQLLDGLVDQDVG